MHPRVNRQITIQGTVQGVGYRPLVYRLAKQFAIVGWVRNNLAGLQIEAEGSSDQLECFISALRSNPPPAAQINSFEIRNQPISGYDSFIIRHSQTNGETKVQLLSDLASCSECLAETMSPDNRRYLYPFTNCTQCGPRYSIISRLPYDRQNTTMAAFTMCTLCQAEYDNPDNRRFHAQPNACPECGPQLQLLNTEGEILASGNEAIKQGLAVLMAGKIVALKGLGGFQLVCDATNDQTILGLRQRKQRGRKSMAIMCADLAMVKEYCQITSIESWAIRSAQSPIVLLNKKPKANALSREIVYNNPCLGVMLPTTPLHHILLQYFQRPLIVTSGNQRDEPMIIENDHALRILNKIADFFLTHDRQILRPVDDSLLAFVSGRQLMLRRGRGFAPGSIVGGPKMTISAVALGANEKNSIAFCHSQAMVLSQHLGDLDRNPNIQRNTLTDLSRLYALQPQYVICDYHPEYASSHLAKELSQQHGYYHISYQHHLAHIFSVLAEYAMPDRLLGLAWDGLGLGYEHGLWGSECLIIEQAPKTHLPPDHDGHEVYSNPTQIRPVARLQEFKLLGLDTAARNPGQMAVSLLISLFDRENSYNDQSFYDHNIVSAILSPEARRYLPFERLRLLFQMHRKNLQAPPCSSMGRLFDAVAFLLDIWYSCSFSGEAAMELEFAAWDYVSKKINNQGKTLNSFVQSCPKPVFFSLPGDWPSLLGKLIQAKLKGENCQALALHFHHSLAHWVLYLCQKHNISNVVVSGGVFQNRLLLELIFLGLRQHQINLFLPSQTPINDGGIAIGQLMLAQLNSEGNILYKQAAL